jgi:hypothetical protein
MLFPEVLPLLSSIDDQGAHSYALQLVVTTVIRRQWPFAKAFRATIRVRVVRAVADMVYTMCMQQNFIRSTSPCGPRAWRSMCST